MHFVQAVQLPKAQILFYFICCIYFFSLSITHVSFYRLIMLGKQPTFMMLVISLMVVHMLFPNTLAIHGCGIVYVLVVELMEVSVILIHIQVTSIILRCNYWVACLQSYLFASFSRSVLLFVLSWSQLAKNTWGIWWNWWLLKRIGNRWWYSYKSHNRDHWGCRLLSTSWCQRL